MPTPEVLQEDISKLKQLLLQIDKDILKKKREIGPNTEQVIKTHFNSFIHRFNDTIENSENKKMIGEWVQSEILPYLLMSENAKRWYEKPLGYAGDFLTIEKIYNDKAKGSGRLGNLLDRCFLDVPASVAVKNRRALLVDEILKVVNSKNGHEINITSMASGPAREVFDALKKIDCKKDFHFHLIDIDKDAIGFVKKDLALKKLPGSISFYNENLLYLAKGRRKIDLHPQDLIYSIGLIDYFNDKYVLELINYAYTLLKPEGKLILGNFHPKNPTKAFMDYIVEWPLIHRSEDDMNRLFLKSKFNKEATNIKYEDQGINLFAECTRD